MTWRRGGGPKKHHVRSSPALGNTLSTWGMKWEWPVHAVQAEKKSPVTRATTFYSHGEQKGISRHETGNRTVDGPHQQGTGTWGFSVHRLAKPALLKTGETSTGLFPVLSCPVSLLLCLHACVYCSAATWLADLDYCMNEQMFLLKWLVREKSLKTIILSSEHVSVPPHQVVIMIFYRIHVVRCQMKDHWVVLVSYTILQ